MTSDEMFTSTIAAIRASDVKSLERILVADPSIASSRLGGMTGGRTPLHVVTDWPGFLPAGPRMAELLIGAGAIVDARSRDDERGETPLHWTASNDDAAIAEVLVDAGADIEIGGGSIGTPLDNAIGYGCWSVAHLLVRRGARSDKLWQAAALGDLGRLEELLDRTEEVPDSISQAFWHACAAGQRRAAEMLLGRGADLRWSPDYAEGTALEAARQPGAQRNALVEWLEACS